MQFKTLISTFLERLGYSEQTTIYSVFSDSSADDDYANESTVVLVLGKDEERVIGLFMLADERDNRSTVAKSGALQKIAQKFDSGIGLYIISHTGDSISSADSIEFHRCEIDGPSSLIDINDFPSYSEMWLMNSIGSRQRKAEQENSQSKTVIGYAYFFAVLFLVLAVGDIFVEKFMHISYLNTQRALLIVGSVFLLFIPGFFRKNYNG